MKFKLIIASLLLVQIGVGSEALPSDAPDLSALKGAIVVVVVKGVVPSAGNAPAAIQGTGFFVSKDGFLVTSYHLRSDLGKVDDATVSYEVHFGSSGSDQVPASPVYINSAADIMVLYAPVADRDVSVLTPTERSGVIAGVTPIFTAGYPEGYQYTVDQGIVKNFGLLAPVPLWATSITFKVGQSGSPIVLGNGKVIAIAKATDQDASSIGLVVPIRLVPSEYWDGSLRLTQAAAAALSVGDTNRFGRVRVQTFTAPAKATEREVQFELANTHCEGSSTKSYHVAATSGWQIDPSSIKVETLSAIGPSPQVVLAERSSDNFTIAAQLTNLGSCVNVFGAQNAADIPARLIGRVSYKENPSVGAREILTLSDTALLGNVKISIPSTGTDSLQFSILKPTGEVYTFTPTPSELTRKGESLVLDTSKVAARFATGSPPG
jgi:Trypsin-like peptidase domain